MEKTMENEMDAGITRGIIGIESLLVAWVDAPWIGVLQDM